MLYRDQFIYALPEATDARKQEVISHMNNMQTNSYLFRLVEIFEYFCEKDTPLKVKQMAAGFSSLLHQYYVFNWAQDDVSASALKTAKMYYPENHPVWNIYANDKGYWHVKSFGKYYENMDLDNFQDFESIGLRHRSYTFVLYETLKPYFKTGLGKDILKYLQDLMRGFSYFYDVIMYTNWRNRTLTLEYSKFSERRSMRFLQQQGYDLSDLNYHTLQKYVLATGEYENFIVKARHYYQKSYDGFAEMLNQNARIRVIKLLLRKCDLLLKEAHDMFK